MLAHAETAPAAYVLLNPGPVNVSSAVRAAMAGPDWCHRQSEALDLLQGVRARLRRAFELPESWSSVVLAGSGTAAVEAMLVSGVPPGRGLLVLCNGAYGARMAAMGRAHGIDTHCLEVPPTATFDLAAVERALNTTPHLGAVALVHHETTLGLLNPVHALAALCAARGLPVLLDSVSGLGCEVLNLHGLHMVAGTANKCVQGLPGVSFVLGRRAALQPQGAARGVYLDLAALHARQEAGDTAFTLPVQCLMALHTALGELMLETVAGRRQRYARHAAWLRAGLERAGLPCVLPAALRSHSLTAARVPPPDTAARILAGLKEAGFVAYGGAVLDGAETLRLANMGELRAHDLDACCARLLALRQAAA